MIRLAFSLLLLLHGLIHLLGFLKEFHLAGVTALSGKNWVPLSGGGARTAGILWLVAAALFTLTTLLWQLKKEEWWMAAAVAVLLSQALIALYWSDAGFGTIANVIVVLVAIGGYGHWRFSTMVQRERLAFLPAVSPGTQVVTEDLVTGLPSVVGQWLRRSRIVGKPFIRTAHLQQKGLMRTQPDGRWMPVAAEQYFRTEQPGFLWIADVQMAPGVHLAGRDKYYEGRGYMLIKLFSLLPVADASGKTVDQGTLLRYLAETVWFPSAALSPYIRWEQLDAGRARATMHYGEVTASGVFGFSPEGDVRSFEAQRYYDRPEGATLETWRIEMIDDGYREFEGVRVPARSSVTWKLKKGDFTWYQLEISDLVYNR